MSESNGGDNGIDRGVIGDRELLAVQTFDIARLTNHPVPIVPNTFVAVSGQGPRGDSNGSGKTTFLAAVSLLLADPQWGLLTNGGRPAAGLLFKPAPAGIDLAQRIPPAAQGFVVGVFAEQDDPESTARTIWIRIEPTTPHVQVRWADGAHLIAAGDDDERDRQAPLKWRALKRNGTISARQFAEVCFGDAPRCLSYLDTSLRPPAPSLLSHQLTEMEPHEIGAALISLSGAKHLIDQERRDRAALLAQRRALAESEAADRENRREEETRLSEVRARNKSRSMLDKADRSWQVFLAKRYLHVLARDEDLAERLRELDAQRLPLAEDLRDKGGERDALAAERDCVSLAERTLAEWEVAKESLASARDERAVLAAGRAQLADRRAQCRARATGWTKESVAKAQNNKEDAERLHVAALVRVASATAAVEEAAAVLMAAEQGLGGSAGQLTAALNAAGCSAAPLFDAVTVDEAQRAHWEPRLWPWRDAVVVAGGVEDVASVAAEFPGALLVTEDEEPIASPAGIGCRFAIGGFLRTLSERWTPEDSERWVHDDGQRTTVFGGFAGPVAGREALVTRLRGELDQKTAAQRTAAEGQQAAASALAVAITRYDAAVAAAELTAIAAQDADLAARLSDVDARIIARETAEREKFGLWRQAQDIADQYQYRTLLAESKVEQAQQALDTHDERMAAVKQDRVALDVERWRVLWPTGRDGADHQLHAEPGFADRKAESLGTETMRRIYDAFEACEFTPDSEQTPADMRRAFTLLARLEGQLGLAKVPTVTFADVTSTLSKQLEDTDAHDRRVLTTIDEEQAKRRRYNEHLREEVDGREATVRNLQAMIGRSIEGTLDQVSQAFNRLDLDNGGFGADLVVHGPPPADDGVWRWEVTPRWRRSQRGGLVSYQVIANGAQVKVHAVQLVLAALLADTSTQGRVLVLDELGNSLGDVNRKDILRVLKTVAEERRVTVLGTCQDSVLLDASEVCGELLWFNHAHEYDTFNRPTRAWGFDDQSRRVELTAPALRAGRTS
ncbi:hypothetical protein [Kutzneria sp. 744]|uniref:hypothetical protein n=1 Tax=Kutzneria sp. (strain 744) TaxID=345341 RepID=UPI0003EEC5F0|nr:hypothetical protein [Kutzneria sp. 744]EWM19163.1 LigA protein [Kutzneria sp. 744]